APTGRGSRRATARSACSTTGRRATRRRRSSDGSPSRSASPRRPRPSARTSSSRSSRSSASAPRTPSSIESEAAARREERHLVVRLAESRREDLHEVPEDLVREILSEEEDLLERVARDDEEPAPLVGLRVRAPGRRVDQRHLAEGVARAEDGERFLAHAADL